MKRYLILIACVLLTAVTASAQKFPERSQVRKGNRAYDRGRYERSIERYTRALEFAPNNYEALYDLGNALAAAERYDKAEETLRAAAADTLRSGDERAEAYFNLGNVQLSQQKLQEALESYKNSLRMNPSDEEAKYNYVYVKRLLQNQDGGGGGDQNQDQNSDGQQDNKGDKGDNGDNNDPQNGQNDPQNGDQDEGDDGDNSDNGDKDDDGDRDGEQREVPAEPRISEQEQERMLEAIQAEEDKTQDKLKDKVRGVIVKGRKNW